MTINQALVKLKSTQCPCCTGIGTMTPTILCELYTTECVIQAHCKNCSNSFVIVSPEGMTLQPSELEKTLECDAKTGFCQLVA